MSFSAAHRDAARALIPAVYHDHWKNRRITRATPRVEFGYSAERAQVVHRLRTVAVYWDRDLGPLLGGAFDCGGKTTYLALCHEPPVGLAACEACGLGRERQPYSQVVYFAERNGLIKIGCTRNVGVRVVALKARLLAFEEGDFARERAVHVQFAASRETGEWFRPTDDLMGYIAELQRQVA